MILRLRNYEDDVTWWALFLMILRMRNHEEDVTMSVIYNDSAHAQPRRRCHHECYL